MNLKKTSLLLMSLIAGCLISCSNEDFIDNPDTKPIEGLSLILTSDAIGTKAIDNSQNADSYATPEELQVNKAHIAFFSIGADGRPDKVIGMKDTIFRNGLSNATTAKEVLAYRINNITVDALKEKVYVLAIANSKHDFSTCKQYADYLAVIESNLGADNQPTALFSPTDLVKRGGMEVDLSKQDLSEAVEIPLTQLAAKVTLNIMVDLPVIKETEGGATHSIDDFLSQIDKGMNSIQGVSKAITIKDYSKNKMGIAYICKNEHGDKGPFWYNGVQCQENVIVHVGDMTTDSIFTTVRPVLFIPSFKINNVETKSDLLIPSTYTDTKLLTLNGWETDIDVARHFSISFYTYQKELFLKNTDKDVLNIELVDAEIINKTEIIKKRYTGASAHAVWTYVPRGNNESDRIPTTGWGDPDKTYKFVYLEDNVSNATLQPVGPPEYIEMPNTGGVLLKNNIIRVNPRRAVDNVGNQICTDGLIHGNLYEVNATVKNTEIGPKLNWEILNMDKVDVIIPFD